MIRLKKDESIVTAFAEPCSGPGWANSLVVVIVRGADRKPREEYLQPEQHTRDMATMFAVSDIAHRTMMREAKRVLRGGARRWHVRAWRRRQMLPLVPIGGGANGDGCKATSSASTAAERGRQ